MTDDDRAADARPGHAARRRDDSRPHHMVQSDGELLDIGPNAEPIEDASLRATERVDLDARDTRAEDDARGEAAEAAEERSPRVAPRFGSAGSGGAELEPGPERP